MLGTAIALAAKMFEEKKDKAGKPYFLHCLRVMNDVNQNDEELMTIAVLHDIIEDTDITANDLLNMGFSARVVTVLDLLTHDKEEAYDAYIRKIGTNKDAIKVKIADLKDNSNITRLKGLREKDFERMMKYHKSFVYLSSLNS